MLIVFYFSYLSLFICKYFFNLYIFFFCFEYFGCISQMRIYNVKIDFNLIELYFWIFQVFFSYSFKINFYAVFYWFCGLVKKDNVGDNIYSILKNRLVFWYAIILFFKASDNNYLLKSKQKYYGISKKYDFNDMPIWFIDWREISCQS